MACLGQRILPCESQRLAEESRGSGRQSRKAPPRSVSPRQPPRQQSSGGSTLPVVNDGRPSCTTHLFGSCCSNAQASSPSSTLPDQRAKGTPRRRGGIVRKRGESSRLCESPPPAPLACDVEGSTVCEGKRGESQQADPFHLSPSSPPPSPSSLPAFSGNLYLPSVVPDPILHGDWAVLTAPAPTRT